MGFYSDDTVTSRAKQELQLQQQQQPPRCAETKLEALRSFQHSNRNFHPPQRSESRERGLCPAGSGSGTQCHLPAGHPASQSLCTSAMHEYPSCGAGATQKPHHGRRWVTEALYCNKPIFSPKTMTAIRQFPATSPHCCWPSPYSTLQQQPTALQSH